MVFCHQERWRLPGFELGRVGCDADKLFSPLRHVYQVQQRHLWAEQRLSGFDSLYHTQCFVCCSCGECSPLERPFWTGPGGLEHGYMMSAPGKRELVPLHCWSGLDLLSCSPTLCATWVSFLARISPPSLRPVSFALFLPFLLPSCLPKLDSSQPSGLRPLVGLGFGQLSCLGRPVKDLNGKGGVGWGVGSCGGRRGVSLGLVRVQPPRWECRPPGHAKLMTSRSRNARVVSSGGPPGGGCSQWL